MSLYIRLKNSFWTHRKTMRLRVKLGEAALWIPPRLWSYAAENQPDGDFSKYSADEIALLVGCTVDASSMLEALQEAGFMDGMKLHDWHEHNGYHERYSERAKKAASARWSATETKGQDKKGKEVSIATSNATSIKARGTEDECKAYALSISLPASDGQWFFAKCEGCGWTNNKQPIKNWKATMRAWQLAGHMASQKSGTTTTATNGTHTKRPLPGQFL